MPCQRSGGDGGGMGTVGYYYPTLEIVGVSNGFTK